MGRLYTVEFENVSVSAAQDLFSISVAANKPVALHALNIDQLTDIGDANEEMLRYRVIRGNATVGSGGTAPTPRPLSSNSAAAGFTARVNDTTTASAGTPINLHSGAFNTRVGLQQIWIPEDRPLATNADVFIVVRLLAAPARTLVMSGTLYVEELV